MNHLNNVGRLQYFCDVLMNEGEVLVASLIKEWMQGLSDPAKTALDHDVTVDDIRKMTVGLVVAVIKGSTATDRRNRVKDVLFDFQRQHLNVYKVV